MTNTMFHTLPQAVQRPIGPPGTEAQCKLMTAEQPRPGHKHKNSLLASPFEQVANSDSNAQASGESIALISPTTQSSQRRSKRRMSGKALFGE